MDDALYTYKLSVQADVESSKRCSWEAQIRKKASETFTEVVTEWCKSATDCVRTRRVVNVAAAAAGAIWTMPQQQQ